VLQQTTRQLWASQGPFKPYTVHGVPQRNVPEDYIKAAVWKTDITPNRYYAQSSTPEESGIPAWYPVEFNPEHICHGFDGKVPDSAVMTTRAGSILVMDYS
jgi:hypothetical protein